VSVFLSLFAENGCGGEESEEFSIAPSGWEEAGVQRGAKRVHGDQSWSRGRATKVRGACHLHQPPSLHAASQGGRGRVRFRPEGNHNHPLPC